jgi:hypothetical protein
LWQRRSYDIYDDRGQENVTSQEIVVAFFDVKVQFKPADTEVFRVNPM